MRFESAESLQSSAGERVRLGVPYRLVPQPPRNLRAETGTMEVTLSWNAPADQRGVEGFRVYKDTETNLIFETRDLGMRRATIKMPSDAKATFMVCSVSAMGRESGKIPVLGVSDNNKYVETGTTGATTGTSAPIYSEWYRERTGGGRRIRL